jgi:hypothetical protein
MKGKIPESKKKWVVERLGWHPIRRITRAEGKATYTALPCAHWKGAEPVIVLFGDCQFLKFDTRN